MNAVQQYPFPTLSDKAYREILNAIVTLELKPGQLVYETEIAEALNVSRTPIREAFRLLRQQGLVIVMPQKGIKVAPIRWKKVNEVRDIRELLFLASYQQLTANWDPRDERCAEYLARSKRSLEKQRLAVERSESNEFFSLDDPFHLLAMQATGNETMRSAYDSIVCHLDRVRYLELIDFQPHMAELYEEHAEIQSAVLAGDPPWVESALKKHFHRFQDDEALNRRHPEYFQP